MQQNNVDLNQKVRAYWEAEPCGTAADIVGDLPAESYIVQIDFNPKDENERLISVSRL